MLPAEAAPALARYTLNPTGGAEPDGSDGIQFAVNPVGRSEQLLFGGGTQYLYDDPDEITTGGGGPILRVGTDAFGWNGGPWASVEEVSVGGSTNGATTGDATLGLRYTAVSGGRTYLLERTISYTFPNPFVRDRYEVTIPSGNTAAVKLFYAADTAPGGSDTGLGLHLTTPVDAVYSVNPMTGVQVGMREVAGDRQFDGAVAIALTTMNAAVNAGDLGGFSANSASTHDAAAGVQWNLGTTAGVHAATFDLGVGFRETALSASFAGATVAAGTAADLHLEVVNTTDAATAGGTFTVTLPAGLAVGTGGATSNCGGTATAAAGGSIIGLTSGTVAAGSNCVLTVPVVAAAAGTYALTNASAVSGGGITNRVPTTSLTVTAPTTTTTTASPAPTTTVPPTTVPPARPIAPPTLGTGTGAGGGAPAALFIDGSGTATDVALPPDAPAGLAAASALGSEGSIAVSPGGQVYATDPRARFGEVPPGQRLNGSIVNLAVDWRLRDAGATWAPSGYWLVGADGGVFTFGSAGFHGSLADVRLNARIIGIAPTPSGEGYWLVGGDGGVFTFGDARFFGSAADLRLGGPIVGIMPTASGRGYSLVGADGGVLTFGDAAFFGAQGTASHRVIGGALTPTGRGYWLVRDDRRLVPFGDARSGS